VADAERSLVGFENATTAEGFVQGSRRLVRGRGTMTLAVRLAPAAPRHARGEAGDEDRRRSRSRRRDAAEHIVRFEPAWAPSVPGALRYRLDAA
jgi:hypothetical protein